MTNQSPNRRKVAVVGGGISGLAAAHRLLELDPLLDVQLFEAEPRLGGVLQTTRTEDGFLLEHSADNFITNIPWGIDLCRRLGMADDLLQTNETLRKAYVVSGGRLHPVPDGFLLMAPGKAWPVVTTPILTWGGKLRLAAEYFVPRRKEEGDECLQSFVTRRMGQQVYERLVQPLIGGIYTADPLKLSVQATLPQFLEMERRYGSLIRGMRKRQEANPAGSQSGARYSMFVAPRHGMHQLVERLAESLGQQRVWLGKEVRRVQPNTDGTWRVMVENEARRFDAVVVALPAPQAAKVLTHQEKLAVQLSRIPYAGCSVAVLTVDARQIARPIEGFGFVVPEIEKRRILAVSFSSYKFPGRAPEGKVIVRVFVGGACHPELADLPNDTMRTLVQEELADLIGLQGEAETFLVTRWNGKMPQYHLGHRQLVVDIENQCRSLAGLELAGNAYHGVGVPQCIRSGEEAAQRVVQHLAASPSAQVETI